MTLATFFQITAVIWAPGIVAVIWIGLHLWPWWKKKKKGKVVKMDEYTPQKDFI